MYVSENAIPATGFSKQSLISPTSTPPYMDLTNIISLALQLNFQDK